MCPKYGSPEPRLARPRDAAASHEADVVARAAGVGDDRRVGARVELREVPAGDRRHRRAGVERVDRRRGDVGGVEHAAVRGDDQHPAAEAGRAQATVEPAQVLAS